MDYRIYAVFDDSSKVYVSPAELRIGFWKYRSDFVSAILDDNVDKVSTYSKVIHEVHDRYPSILQLSENRWLLTRSGFVEQGEVGVKRIRVTDLAGS